MGLFRKNKGTPLKELERYHGKRVSCTDPYRIISGWLDNDSKRKTAVKPKERQGCDLSWYDDFAMNFDLSKFF